MRNRFLTLLPALLAALTLILAPAGVARAGIMGPDKLTIRDENKLGAQFDQIIRSQMPMVGDTYITSYVDKLVQNVVMAKRPMPFHVKSAVVANPILNAFAIPGGYIYVFTGLIQEVTSESQLVGVIAHELAHVSQRHVAQRIEKQKKIGMLSMVGTVAGIFLGVAGGKGSAKMGQALAMSSQGMATAAMLTYSQQDEQEADHVGMNSLVGAGYNPMGMPETFEIMMKNRWFDSGSQMPSYLSTHPGLADRIIYLKDRIKRMPATFTERKDDNTTLHKVQCLIRAKMSSATTAKAYWDSKPESEYTAMDYVGKGIVMERLKDRSEATACFDKALKMDGEDPLVCREVGIFYVETGKQNEAFKFLQKALIKNRHDALGLFYLAKLQAQIKDYTRAAANMRTVMAMVPEDSEVHQSLGMILGESGDTFGGNLQLAYAALYSNDTRRANYYREQAATAATTDAQQKELQALDQAIKLRAALPH